MLNFATLPFYWWNYERQQGKPDDARTEEIIRWCKAKNITTKGLDFGSLIIGSRLKLGGDAEVRITQFGKECHSRCEIFKQVGDCVMPREGIFAEVIKDGSIRVGDAIEVLNDDR